MFRVSEEALGWFLVASLYRRFTSMVTPCCSLLGGGVGILGTRQGGASVGAGGVGVASKTHLYHTYDQTHRINVTTPYIETQQRSRSRSDKAPKRTTTGVTAIGNKSPRRAEALPHHQSQEQEQQGGEGGDRQNIVESSIEDEATNISSNFFSAGLALLQPLVWYLLLLQLICICICYVVCCSYSIFNFNFYALFRLHVRRGEDV